MTNAPARCLEPAGRVQAVLVAALWIGSAWHAVAWAQTAPPAQTPAETAAQSAAPNETQTPARAESASSVLARPQAPTGASTETLGPTAPAGPGLTPEVLAAARRSAQAGAEWLARGVDSWFGTKPFEEGGAVSDGRLSLVLFKRQDQKADLDLRFSARYRLPNIEQRAYVFIGRDDAREVQRDTPDGLADPLRLQTGGGPTQRTLLAGLGLSLHDQIDFRLGLGRRLKPYAQARYSLPWLLAPGHALDFRQTLFWTREDRAGLTTALSLDSRLSSTLALRWLNASTTTQQAQATQWSSSLGLYAELGGHHHLSLEALFNGTSQRGPGVIVSDRGLLAKWERPVHSHWLLAELIAGHFWPLRDASGPRQRAWAVGAGLKMKL